MSRRAPRRDGERRADAMASVRVGALGLRLVAPGLLEPSAPALQREAGEVFVPAVLRAMERRLARVYGARAIIRIRRLSIRCTLRPSELAAGDHAAQLGEELAAQIAATVPHPRGGTAAPSSAIAEIYRDRAHFTAVALTAAAERREGPDGVREEFAVVWRKVAQAAPAELVRILRRCQAAGTLAHVLARLDMPMLAALEPLAAVERAPAIMVAVRAAIAAKRRYPAVARRAASATRPGMPEVAHESPREGDAREPAIPSPAREDDIATDSEPPVDTVRPEGPTVRQPPTPAPASDHPDELPRPEATPALRKDAPIDAARDMLAHPPLVERMPSVPVADPDEPDPALPDASASYRSDWGRLLFLLNIAMRLELPERLWQVGADEGAALAAAFALLTGDEDCAPRLLHAAFPDAPPQPGEVPQWARDELAEGVRAAAPRLLGPDADLAALDERVALFEAQLSPGGYALAAWCAAIHLAFAEAMIGESLAPGALRERFACGCRIALDRETIGIFLPIDSIDLGLRRAGLEADPGLLPWLGKRIVFEFEGGEA
jgi:hypothetical protein